MRETTNDRRFRCRQALAALIAGAALLGAWPAAAESGGQIRVFMDHARILRLDRPVDKVIIGNSNIADVTVADPKTIVLTGKSFGATNLVLFGKDGEAILDDNVLVSIDEENTVRVYRQADRKVLSCSPYCEENTNGAPAAGK